MSAHKDFARIIKSSDGRQVLFYVEPDGGDYVLHQIATHDEFQADIGIGFTGSDADLNEKRAYLTLEAMDQASADKAIQVVKKLMGEAS
jgi:hypothetical protein